MIEGYIDINNVPTHILCWGTWINDHFNETTKDIVLVITGNPGLPGFYSSFASTLFNELNGGFGGKRKFPIWIIGHAGASLLIFRMIYLNNYSYFKVMTNRRKNLD